MDRIFEPQFIWLDRVDSTNSYCNQLAKNGELEGCTVAAYIQEQGRGQRGNSWESEEGKNLTFSLLLRPTFLKVEEQFYLSKVIALSVCDWIKNNSLDAKIKWPNDIYVGDNKIAGILIENSFSSTILDVSVIGIGLNLNQTLFSDDIPNPTSMKLLTGKHYQIEIVLSELVVSIQLRYMQLRFGLKMKIDDDYINSLYRFNEYNFFTGDEGRLKARIIGVKPTGELILETKEGELKTFAFKEVTLDI
jgi:BirA family transcriptional regulator, biotin operon repressor / biotin---[acetyl-CoA-carboxylase] ligase